MQSDPQRTAEHLFPSSLCHLMNSMGIPIQELTFVISFMPPMLEVSADTRASCSSSTVHDNGADADEKSSKYDPYLIDEAIRKLEKFLSGNMNTQNA